MSQEFLWRHSRTSCRRCGLGTIRQLRSTVQTAVALVTTNKLESKDFPDTYPELADVLITIWHTLPSETQDAIWETLPLETQHTIMHELSKPTAGFWRSLSVPKMVKKVEIGGISEHRKI